MEKFSIKHMKCDVLVVGGGGGGIRAALVAADAGMNVILASETKISGSGSTFYPFSHEWGMLYATDQQDAQQFQNEILTASGECLNKALADKLARDSTRAYEQLVREGVPFVPMRDVGITGCFGRQPRGAFLDDMRELTQAWERELGKRKNIRIETGQTIVSLVSDRMRCYGAVAVDRDGNLTSIRAAAVVLACGGGEGLYEYGAAYGKLYGSAYAMAARYGVRLVNLEFIQFVHGSVSPKKGINYYPFSYREIPAFYNGKGETCLKQYLPAGMSEEECILAHAAHGPFSTDSKGKYLEYAMVGEYRKGNGLGLTVVPDADRVKGNRYRLWERFLNRFGMNAATPMTLYPFAQGFNGGILPHEDIHTDMEGLFACGESAGGCHGPNRMGGLCVLATQVFGEAAGKAAVSYAEKRPDEQLSDAAVEERLRMEFADGAAETETAPENVMRCIRSTMQQYACLHRNEEGLARALEEIEKLKIYPLSHLCNGRTTMYFDAYNAIDAARLILTSMRQRKESRGCHDRSDYPMRDEKQTKMNWVTMDNGLVLGGTLETEP